uniref:Very-long-chain (3R)-3-hydroxyacyl-CoA dehydratase n=1 Tax=Amphimedon queenslandica TaxID=400682 RepID=A0A1X7UXB0_AMPQE
MIQWHLESFTAFRWSTILLKTLKYYICNHEARPGLNGTAIGELRFFQTLACLELVHCIVGIVPSSVVLTFFQLFSRVAVVWGVPSHCMNQSVGMLLAQVGWSITEVIRYIYYACLLMGSKPYAITYLRYTLFYVLYPIGVLGEQILVYNALPLVRATQQWSIFLPNPWNISFSYYYFGYFGIMLYLSVFPQLYGHMIKQRQKALYKEKNKKSL